MEMPRKKEKEEDEGHYNRTRALRSRRDRLLRITVSEKNCQSIRVKCRDIFYRKCAL